MQRAMRLLLALIAAGSLAGCAAHPANTLPPAPTVVQTRECPAPARPVLPGVDGTLPFDAPANVATLLERDDLFRTYATGLEATVDCYRAQVDPQPVSTSGKER